MYQMNNRSIGPNFHTSLCSWAPFALGLYAAYNKRSKCDRSRPSPHVPSRFFSSLRLCVSIQSSRTSSSCLSLRSAWKLEPSGPTIRNLGTSSACIIRPQPISSVNSMFWNRCSQHHFFRPCMHKRSLSTGWRITGAGDSRLNLGYRGLLGRWGSKYQEE